MTKLKIASKEYLESIVNKRANETKLGEQIVTLNPDNWENELHQSATRFVILGISEDIGIRANYGTGGAYSTVEPAFKAIVNIQSNNILEGSAILLLGWFDFTELMQRSAGLDAIALRPLVAEIDDIVAEVIEKIVAAGKIPIVIGGGHNNAYPILMGSSKALKTGVNSINLDAHCDYRIMEGRHSGNGFRYARQNGFLDKYAVIGIHENYNSRQIIEEFRNDPNLFFSFYEDIFIREQKTFHISIKEGLLHTNSKPRGVEIDLDAIERTLSSAGTPCGVSSVQARQYITQCAISGNAIYLHVAEGAILLEDGRQDMQVAKLIAYLVTDFIKGILIWDY